VGEVVITSFNRDYPLIRFGTGDLSAVMTGHSPCGRTNVRIRGWLGRADQTTKVRGMFVHPAQVAQLLARHPEVARARLVVSGALAQDELSLHCQLHHSAGVHHEADRLSAAHANLRAALIQSIRDITGLRAEVVFVAADALPNDGKVIADERSYH